MDVAFANSSHIRSVFTSLYDRLCVYLIHILLIPRPSSNYIQDTGISWSKQEMISDTSPACLMSGRSVVKHPGQGAGGGWMNAGCGHHHYLDHWLQALDSSIYIHPKLLAHIHDSLLNWYIWANCMSCMLIYINHISMCLPLYVCIYILCKLILGFIFYADRPPPTPTPHLTPLQRIYWGIRISWFVHEIFHGQV